MVRAESPEINVDGGSAKVTFRQIYKSGNLTDGTRNTFLLAKENGGWKIRQESAAS
jgi:colicin import membrane protein